MSALFAYVPNARLIWVNEIYFSNVFYFGTPELCFALQFFLCIHAKTIHITRRLISDLSSLAEYDLL